MLSNWQREAERFAPTLKVHRHHGSDRAESAAAFSNADVVLTSYPLLQRDEKLLTGIDWNVVVFDEAQTLKNAKAKSYVSAQSLRAQQRIAAAELSLHANQTALDAARHDFDAARQEMLRTIDTLTQQSHGLSEQNDHLRHEQPRHHQQDHLHREQQREDAVGKEPGAGLVLSVDMRIGGHEGGIEGAFGEDGAEMIGQAEGDIEGISQ